MNGARTPDGDLTQRLEEAYRRTTGAATPRGARAWVARLARLDKRSVSRMLGGQIPADRIEATLDAIEAGRRGPHQDEGR